MLYNQRRRCHRSLLVAAGRKEGIKKGEAFISRFSFDIRKEIGTGLSFFLINQMGFSYWLVGQLVKVALCFRNFRCEILF